MTVNRMGVEVHFNLNPFSFFLKHEGKKNQGCQQTCVLESVEFSFC